MGKVHVFDHPLIQHKLSFIRDVNTGTKAFRELVDEVGMLMAYEVTRDLELQEVEIETPVTKAIAKRLSGKKLAFVPILRGSWYDNRYFKPCPRSKNRSCRFIS